MVFATHGLPEKLVSDNGSNFTSDKFEQLFLNKRNQAHKDSPIYHPASSGLADGLCRGHEKDERGKRGFTRNWLHL